jgi:leader peptidase (prepilin peptidase) / N-methyltransferase
LGFGDVRLAALLGLALGWVGAWYLLIGFMVANIVGAATGIALIAAGRANRQTQMPYGVFLAVGAWVAIFIGAPIIAWYSHLSTR